MVVLSLGLEPSASLPGQAERLGVELNRWGFAHTDELQPAGHFAAGRVRRRGLPGAQGYSRHRDAGQRGRGPGDGPAGRGAAAAEVRTKSYPPERDVTDEPPRVGVFVCHCGSNIAAVVDVQRVVAAAAEVARRGLGREPSTPAPTTARSGSSRRSPSITSTAW